MSILVTATNIILHILQKFHAKNITISDPRNNVEVLQKVQYIDGSTTDDLKLMEHPIEDGTMITDHIVDDPKGCNIKIKIDMENINFYFLNGCISILLPYLLLCVFQLYFHLKLFLLVLPN